MQYYMDSEFSQHALLGALVNCVHASVQCLNCPKITGGLKLWDHPRFATEQYLRTEWGVETDPPGGRKAALFGRVDQRTGGIKPPTFQTLHPCTLHPILG